MIQRFAHRDKFLSGGKSGRTLVVSRITSRAKNVSFLSFPHLLAADEKKFEMLWLATWGFVQLEKALNYLTLLLNSQWHFKFTRS